MGMKSALSRFRFALFVGLAAFCFDFLMRLILAITAQADISEGLSSKFAIFLRGAFYDAVSITYLLIPFVVYLTLVPSRIFHTKLHRILGRACLLATLFLLAFGASAEWFFWEEFDVRFNFIAVDYLIYTTEVVANIRESYPLHLLLPALLVVAFLISRFLTHTKTYRAYEQSGAPFLSRLAVLGLFLTLPAASWFFVDGRTWQRPANPYDAELSSNGRYSFGEAFWANELPYPDFYPCIDRALAWEHVREYLPQAQATEHHRLLRHIKRTRPESDYNVVLLTVESLSAKYLGHFGNLDHLTPSLDAIAERSVVFERCFATGTRTIRGMEALTLSIPPTPGSSVVKRKNIENLGTIASLLEQDAYDSVFLYGGDGYFDNMNAFFGSNGFRIVDQKSQPDSRVSFSNAWGVCDEDLYSWSLEEADRAHEAGRPFFHFIMSVSNHRPYTFPEGRIDTPQGRRASAVQYTDFSIGKFLKDAEIHPWFRDTIFVVVADHCASSAGRTTLPVEKYHIPLFFYAPGLLPSRRIETLASQIDVVPSILGLLGKEYDSAFYGRDLFDVGSTQKPMAFIGTYQKLGFLTPDWLTVLTPRSDPEAFAIDLNRISQTAAPLRPDHTAAAISFYQTAWETLAGRAR